MTRSALSLDRCPDSATWDAFVSSSPQDSIFCRSQFLAALDVEFDLWLVTEGGNLRLAAMVPRRENDVVAAPYSFTLYQGVLIAADVAAAAAHYRFHRIPELLAFALHELSLRYSRLSFCLHHTFEDLRAFQWFHYHEPEQGRFTIDLGYTGLLDLRAYGDFDGYLATIRPKNRQHYRNALRQGLTVETSADVDILDRLDESTFQRQGVARDPRERELLRAIARAALKGGFGELLVCCNGGGDVVSAALFLLDGRCGYSMFAGTDPDQRDTNAGTLLLLEHVRRCFARGLAWVDTCGVNSPQRGEFKTSFNAVPVPYFVASWEAASR
jgi:hypothetical protein